jgi:hypothetical protein
MRATGDYVTLRTRGANAGLAEGPLLVVNALSLPANKRDPLVESIFKEDPKILAKMSEGHRKVAKDMQPRFAPLLQYYKSAAAGGWRRAPAWAASAAFRSAIPDNYSPTSYLINTLLPRTNSKRTMDYVATVMFE